MTQSGFCRSSSTRASSRSLRFTNESRWRGAPGYRSALERRADYLIGLAWLGRYDLFAVGSQAVKAELEQFRAIEPSRVVIAGRAVSSEFEPNPADLPIPFGDRRHVVVAVGSGEREDLEGVLAAHARSGMRRRYPLLVIGSCSPDLRAGLRERIMDGKAGLRTS